MRSFQALVVLLLGLSGTIQANLCTNANKEMVGRVVFGEARGESANGRLAVAWVIVNRVSHAGYPNTLNGVVNARVGSHHEFNTLDSTAHDTAWTDAKSANNAEYRDAINAATGALCDTMTDPTRCAVSFCATNPCSATASNTWWEAYCHSSVSPCPQKIGNHYFVCRRAAPK